jgi:solute carrier family 12 (potassium/chloride transporter), member 4/6
VSQPDSTTENILDASPRELGAFLGVFTPSILTILGVIMYMRFGWVVANEGLLNALLIVIIANAISLITTFSVSATATNMQVGIGGAYYIISRSLGLEIGGAIGVPLFLSQTFSITLYALGLAESFRFVYPDIPIITTAAIIIVLIMLISLVSASLALKLQIPIMITIFLSIGSLMLGARWNQNTAEILQSIPESPGFWVVFAVFFPAVTGFLAGVSMSGNLRNPKRDIPRGALSAVLTGFAVYLLLPVFLAFSAPRNALLTDSLVWTQIARYSWLILPGLWGAVFSSAIGSTLSAPRTLQALSFDRITPKFFQISTKKRGEPWIAILFSSGIALLTLLLGDLNAIAPILTIFFLTTYGMINLVAGIETLIGDLSYRPAIKVPWFVSLAGALACFGVMALISLKALIVAVVFESAIWFYLRRRALQATWGDARRGIWMSLARQSLINLGRIEEKPRGWRPNILLFSGDVRKRLDLIRFASWLEQDRGFVTVCNIITGQDEHNMRQALTIQKHMSEYLESKDLQVFCRASVVENFESGIIDIVQSVGMATLESNTIMFGWTHHVDRLASYLKIMRQAAYLRKSMIICKIQPRHFYNRSKTIDIWWGGQQRNGDIMLLMAYLLSLNPEWTGSDITLKSIARSTSEQQKITAQLDEMIPEIRIKCSRQVFLKAPDINIQAFIHQESGDADVVFLGLAQPDPGNEMDYAHRLTELVQGLGTVVLIKNSSMFVGELIT